MAVTPPYQLIKGDKYNMALGVLTAFTLAITKDLKSLPPFVRWQLVQRRPQIHASRASAQPSRLSHAPLLLQNAFTNWNLIFITLRVVLQQRQWDPFLAVNSMGILAGFRTAMTQGLDDNMRHKIASYGLPLPRPVFMALDHAVHTLPSVVLITRLVQQNRHVPQVLGSARGPPATAADVLLRCPQMNALFSLILSTWFAFRQSAKLDSSDIYVPHPWRRTWLAILVSALSTPALVNSLIAKSSRRTAIIGLVMLLPYLSTRLDPNLRSTYNFEYKVCNAKGPHKEPSQRASTGDSMPRVQSSFM